MDVGIRELKAHLSAVLQRASAGEVITVTDRGRPIAVLGPPVCAVDLERAAAEGWLTPATATGFGPATRQSGRMSVLDALAEDRGE